MGINRYKIILTDDNGVYLRDSDYYINLSIHNSITPCALTDPSTVSITITDPCDNTLVDAAAMTKSSTGIYTYDYIIPSTAPFGKYTVNIITTTYAMVKQYDFYVLEWDMVKDVRRYSGICESKTISDEDLAAIIWNSWMETTDEIFDFWKDEQPTCNPDTGLTFNGSNITVTTLHKHLADSNGDGNITGFGEQSCGTDITGYWLDADFKCYTCNITVICADEGRIEVTQTDGSAIPSDNEGVFLTYYTEYESYDRFLHKEAVSYLAAHKVIKRFGALDKSTLVDLSSNKIRFLADPNRLLEIYESIRDKIRQPMIGGTK